MRRLKNALTRLQRYPLNHLDCISPRGIGADLCRHRNRWMGQRSQLNAVAGVVGAQFPSGSLLAVAAVTVVVRISRSGSGGQ